MCSYNWQASTLGKPKTQPTSLIFVERHAGRNKVCIGLFPFFCADLDIKKKNRRKKSAAGCVQHPALPSYKYRSYHVLAGTQRHPATTAAAITCTTNPRSNTSTNPSTTSSHHGHITRAARRSRRREERSASTSRHNNADDHPYKKPAPRQQHEHQVDLPER